MNPWREQFQRDPEQAIADLFRGRASLGASLRRDLPEVLYYEFPPEQSADRERLDQALLHWLAAMRRNYQREIGRLDFDVYSLRLCHALRAMQLLELPRSRYQLRELQDDWLPWLRPLRLAPERDPALELYRLLTQAQPDDQAAAGWLALAENPRPEYLSVALLGLQRLPISDNRQQQTLQVSALLRHYGQQVASAEQQAAAFQRRFAALRGLYPRGPEHWNGVLMEALVLTERDKRQFFTDFTRLLQGEKPKKAKGSGVSCPNIDRNKAVKDAITNRQTATASASQQLLQLLEGYQHYAEHSGDGYFFVRTLCNQGNLLLCRPDIDAQTLARLGHFIELALDWEPRNEFVWTFWASYLAYQGLSEQQRWVLRETVRLLPEAAACRVELARLLMHQGQQHWPEAERWLRQVVEFSPNNEPSRVELARLLMGQGREHWPEAEQHLRLVIKNHPDHGQSRVILAQFLASSGRREEGLAILDEFLARQPNNARAQAVRNMLRQGGGQDYIATLNLDRDTEDEAPSLPPARRQPHPEASVALPKRLAALQQPAQWQQAFYQAAHDPQAQRELQEAATTGDVLAGVYWQCLPGADATIPVPPGAWAWRAARCVSGLETDWRSLEQAFPEYWGLSQSLQWLQNPTDEGLAARLQKQWETSPRPTMQLLKNLAPKIPAWEAAQRRDLSQALLLAEAL